MSMRAGGSALIGMWVCATLALACGETADSSTEPSVPTGNESGGSSTTSPATDQSTSGTQGAGAGGAGQAAASTGVGTGGASQATASTGAATDSANQATASTGAGTVATSASGATCFEGLSDSTGTTGGLPRCNTLTSEASITTTTGGMVEVLTQCPEDNKPSPGVPCDGSVFESCKYPDVEGCGTVCATFVYCVNGVIRTVYDDSCIIC